MRKVVPASLPIDTFEGQAWLGVVPFRMSGVRPQGVPAFPGFSAFPELNVRTYTVIDGKPGVYFFSLDAANHFAVAAARLSFRLPYFYARMSCRSGEEIQYESHRADRASGPARLVGRYGPTGPVSESEPGSLVSWLTDRFCLYTADRRGRVHRSEIYHDPWPLQPAGAAFTVNTMVEPIGLVLPDVPPILHFSRRLDVLIWPPHRV